MSNINHAILIEENQRLRDQYSELKEQFEIALGNRNEIEQQYIFDLEQTNEELSQRIIELTVKLKNIRLVYKKNTENLRSIVDSYKEEIHDKSAAIDELKYEFISKDLKNQRYIAELLEQLEKHRSPKLSFSEIRYEIDIKPSTKSRNLEISPTAHNHLCSSPNNLAQKQRISKAIRILDATYAAGNPPIWYLAFILNQILLK